jgi:O-antigen/teichoic acid export membrane protein
MNLPPAIKVLTITGVVVGVALAVAASIDSSYWLAVIGAVCALRLVIYYVCGRRSPKILPNESYIRRLLTQRRNRGSG